MKKIAIFTGSIYTVGGEQRVVSLVANKLSEKHEVTIFTMDRVNSGRPKYDINESIGIEYFHPYHIYLHSIRKNMHFEKELPE